MTGYLRRLATTGAAYTASSVISKLIAVALLPLYTRYLSPADYGAAEVLLTGVIAASIVIRLGVIEALLRFYYADGPERVVKTAFAFFDSDRRPGDRAALRRPALGAMLSLPDAGLLRIAIVGLWVFTMFEFLLTLFRLDERAKAFLYFTVANVLVTIPATVWFVVVQEEGAEGLLLGQYGTGAVFLAGLLVAQRRRCRWSRPAAARGWPLSGCRRCRPSSRCTRSTSSTASWSSGSSDSRMRGSTASRSSSPRR
jgi:O-antigen/teichoic acid export membrane protein